MRLIGHIDNDVNARTFGDYLYVQGIENEMERESNGTYAVWIVEEDRLEQARQLLEQFQQNPANPEYKRQGSSADEKRAAVARDEKEARKRIVNVRQIFPQTRAFGVGPFTFLLICACVLVAFLSKLGGPDGVNWPDKLESLRPILGLFIVDLEFPDRVFLGEVRHGEVWRLFTPMLIHFSIMHILGNMMWLFQLGSMIEDRRGTVNLIIMVIVISGASNVAQLLWSANPFFGGMSGVVSGLFGYVWIRGRMDKPSGFFMDRQSEILMFVWLFLCAIGAVGRIANAAHFSGLILGILWGYLDTVASRRNR